ncbi:tetratricopeptide repeat protein [Gordonia otitidis]|uniref:tetratricopeptide repeat protein n=1 Tax=Gordonia otitidis TaxID=249058 RepID=UPI002355A2FB|nr:tetratricopeptide repeat protein [Gordonia otitidis]
MTRSHPRPFTPAQEDPAVLDQRTVGRGRLLDTLTQRLITAATTRSRPHTLLVGPRGSGKSHLLRVALHRMAQDSETAARLLVAEIPEDAMGITRYDDLLYEIGVTIGLQLARRSNTTDLEGQILDATADRTLVLVIENLDRVFASISTAGQRNLRSWVETSGQILLFAATPSLFVGVHDRTEPWFGGLITTPLDGLSTEDGRKLLTRLAEDRGDTALATFLDSDVGAARVNAVGTLTGGSPRIWMVLSECLTVDSLDQLIPAVEDLVEGLVPYYQQLLWDLAPNQQAIVRQLAEGAAAAQSTKEIADATGLTQQTVSKALELLRSGRWVSAEKVPGGDKRKTWYSLREPMLRHHFQWRSGRGEPLALVVELLREWYQPGALRTQLAGAAPNSPAERYLVQSLKSQVPTFDFGYSTLSLVDLLAEARRWIDGEDDVYTADCGRYVELCVLMYRGDDVLPAEHMGSRPPLAATDSAVAHCLDSTNRESLVGLLAAASESTTGPTKAGLLLVAGGWLQNIDPSAAVELLHSALAETGGHAPLDFAIRLEIAGCSGRASARQALDELTQMLDEVLEVLGEDHLITLTTRGLIAYYTGETGHPDTALTLYQQLLDDRTRILGPDHRNTLTIRGLIAYYTGETGHPDTALTLYQQLLDDRTRILGPDHRNTLTIRGLIAYYTGETGHPDTALTLYQQFLDDHTRILGPDHPDTLTTRQSVIAILVDSDEPEHALDIALREPPIMPAHLLIALMRLPSAPTGFDVLWHAAHGDEEAYVRLPDELKDVAAKLKTIVAEAPSVTPPAGTPTAP